MRALHHPLWETVWQTLRDQGGQADLPWGLGTPPNPEQALNRAKTHGKTIDAGWARGHSPVLLAFPGVLLYLEAPGPLRHLHAVRIRQDAASGTLADTPGAADLVRARLERDALQGLNPLCLRPAISAHRRMQEAGRHGLAAVQRVEAIAALPHSVHQHPRALIFQGLYLLEAADGLSPSGAPIHRLVAALPT